jgi:hypothetical protein
VGGDGVPEHRGLRREGEQPPDARALHQRHQAYLDRINAYRAATRRQEQQDATSAADASAQGGPQAASNPDALGMPPDPFSGTLPGAIAQAEMLHSLIEGGMTEPQALYYMACLLQVGLAMRMGRFPEELPPWPPETT